MKKTFYIQTDEENRVTDILSRPHEDYKQVELNTPLPPRILGRCYELMDDNSLVYRREWDRSGFDEKLTNQQEILDDIIITMLGGEGNA